MDAAADGLGVIVFLVAVALAFDFMNGFHDAANSIATIVSTRVLRPHYAVAWAAFFNFVAFLVFGLSVADTIGRGGHIDLDLPDRAHLELLRALGFRRAPRVKDFRPGGVHLRQPAPR